MATQKEIAVLFKRAMELDGKVEAAKKGVEAAMDERSKAVKAVFEANGGDNGPFSFKGQLYTIRKRSPQEEIEVNGKMQKRAVPGEETWFFVSIGDKTVTAIE